jgi:hypothetical protein
MYAIKSIFNYGASLQELQMLSGWSSFDIVLRYAHLNGDHLKKAAERVAGTKLVHAA